MNTTEFFDALRERKWMLYVPERIYRAHRDGLLRGWGVSGYKRLSEIERMKQLLELLQSQGADLKIPFVMSTNPDWKEKQILEEFADRIIVHNGSEDSPPFPESVVASDSFWDSLVSRFNLIESLTNRILAWNDRVYRVRFFPLSVTAGKQSLGPWPNPCLSPAEKREWYHEMRKVRAERRVLREDYGLTGEYFGHNNTRRAILAVLKKTYPPEQVRHVRRQLEEKLHKDPAETIRYGLERGLLK